MICGCFKYRTGSSNDFVSQPYSKFRGLSAKSMDLIDKPWEIGRKLNCRQTLMSGFTFLCILISSLTFTVSSKAFSEKSLPYTSCATDSKLQTIRSKELAELFLADQKEREHYEKMSPQEINQLNLNDKARRMRVGEILGEGCINTAKDYEAASFIYQHGDVSDHYYQAFIWANRAVALGDLTLKKMVAMTMDRYLLSIGKKQLFGTQFLASSTTGWCFCLDPVETSFPDSYRMQYLKKKLSEQYEFLHTLNKGKKNCQSLECAKKLSPTTRGSIPGFW